ncbi:hypothetical protein EDD21DRAFT_106976 [Dissophora ornata]|nr:hypothetical protein EDD21DRAFT_106976 [Dissophora ornata]
MDMRFWMIGSLLTWHTNSACCCHHRAVVPVPVVHVCCRSGHHLLPLACCVVPSRCVPSPSFSFFLITRSTGGIFDVFI